MIERLAYWSVVLQMPIYIAQKDVPGTLGWTHIEKGIIFFWWAIFQNLTPLLSGYLADKYSRQMVIRIASLITIIGFIGMSMTNTLYPFLVSAIILGIGLGSMKPAIQGGIAAELDQSNSASGWATYVMMVNLSVFLAPPISIYLKNFGWQYIFWGSATLISCIWIFLFFFKNNQKIVSNNEYRIVDDLKMFLQPRVLYFIIFMTGFTTIYMQFYETLPNFMYDWVDTSSAAKSLGLPQFMLMNTPLNAGMISYEWMYNINTGLIVLFVLPITALTRRFSTLRTIAVGIFITVLGLSLCGLAFEGFAVLIGFVVYTIGEMIVNPKFTQYMGDISDKNKASTYLSYLSISWAVGLAGSGYLGGWLYHHYSEKAMLAKRYLVEVLQYKENIELKYAFEILRQELKLDAVTVTQILAEKYNPEMIWYVFIIIGLISIVGLLLVTQRVQKIR